MVKLGVNIDHVATLRQARKDGIPNLMNAARLVESARADSITIHLREDRRHIQDSDVYEIKKNIKISLNLEMSVNDDIVKIALDALPEEACLVPERRQELTTEGGLDVKKDFARIKKIVSILKKRGIKVSLFIDPKEEQVIAAAKAGSDCVELHTGSYASARTKAEKRKEFSRLLKAGKSAVKNGLLLNAGHGLGYGDACPVAQIPGMNTLNIGFSIIARGLFSGLYEAVSEMKKKINKDRG